MDQIISNERIMSLVYTGVATLVALLILWGYRAAFPWAEKKLLSFRNRELPSLKIMKIELISGKAILGGLLNILRGIRLVGLLAIVYLYFSAIFSFFPETDEFAINMLHYVSEPVKDLLTRFVNYIPQMIYLFVIFFVVRYFLKVIRAFFDHVEQGSIELEGFYAEWARPTYNLVRIFVFCFTLVIIFPMLPGSSSPAFQGVSVFLGLLISLGSGSAISNLISGIVITYMRPFRVGDRVQIGETTGDVIERNLLVTRVRTIKNVDITIPNSMILNSHTMNFSAVAKENGLILHTKITIGYEVPWPRVHELLLKSTERVPGIMKEPAPFVLQTCLDNSYVEYELNAYTNLANEMQRTYSDLRISILDTFNEGGVEIMSPSYFSLRDGNKVTIPEPTNGPASNN